MRTFASPLRFPGEGLPIRLPSPALGEHNEEVLGPLGTTPFDED